MARKGMLRAGNIHETTVESATGAGFRADPVQNFFLERYAAAYRAELDAFIAACAGGEAPTPSGLDGLKAQILADAATQSAQTGKPVAVALGDTLMTPDGPRSAPAMPCSASSPRRAGWRWTISTARDSLGITMKGAQDWLTVADGKVEDFLRQRLARAVPRRCGDRRGGRRRQRSDAVWIIDPIDGTANFARGDRNWCISIGFLLHGVPEIGIISAPALDELYVGRRGQGATLNGAADHGLAATTDIGRACVELGWSTRIPAADYVAMIGRGYAAGASVKRSARARSASAMSPMAAPTPMPSCTSTPGTWRPGLVIAREAGAVINDFFAGEGIATGNPILCCTPALAEQLREITGIV